MARCCLLPLARRAVGLALVAATVTGCADFAYYGQAMSGQMRLLGMRRPVEEVLADNDTTVELRERLQQTSAIRAFASDQLALPDNGSYRSYVDLQQPYVVWNVFATPELSLDLKEWCFPVAGCVVYRGYFDAGSARNLAERLRQEGNDVYLGGVVAYSTLGWFDDPLLNTFLFWPDGRLAELVFHELAHQLLYVPGDTAFNESFATFVGRTGARLWLARCGSPQQLADYEDLLAHRSEVLAIIETARDRLEGLYRSGADDSVKRNGKRRILSKLQEDYAVLKARRGISSRYDRWFAGELNNAKVAAVNSYSEYLPAFDVLFSNANGGFEEFYRQVDVIADLAPEPRQARLEDLMQADGNAMDARVSSDTRQIDCLPDIENKMEAYFRPADWRNRR